MSLLNNTTINEYLKGVSIQNKHTAEVYSYRLVSFQRYVKQNYSLSLDQLITTMTQMGHGPKVDIYQLLSGYTVYLQSNVTNIPLTIKHYLSTARNYLESFDVTIIPRKYNLKVRTPRVIRSEKEALEKEDIRIILESAMFIRQKTYLQFLSSTGCRAQEALSIREKDIDWTKDPVTVFIRGEFTKTRVSRTIMITNEMSAAIQAMLQYKYRTRHVHHYDKNGKSVNEIRTPKSNKELLIFSSNSYQNPTVKSLYYECIAQFEELLDRLGGKFAERENSNKNSHRKITLHSLRRYVYSVVSDLGYNQFADKYMLGHSYDVSTYYRKTVKERIEIFKKIEPYITYLDTIALEKRGADLKTEVESLKQDNVELRQNINKIMEARYGEISVKKIHSWRRTVYMEQIAKGSIIVNAHQTVKLDRTRKIKKNYTD